MLGDGGPRSRIYLQCWGVEARHHPDPCFLGIDYNVWDKGLLNQGTHKIIGFSIYLT